MSATVLRFYCRRRKCGLVPVNVIGLMQSFLAMRNIRHDNILYSAHFITYILYATLTNFSTNYLMMCKVYSDIGGINR